MLSQEERAGLKCRDKLTTAAGGAARRQSAILLLAMVDHCTKPADCPRLSVLGSYFRLAGCVNYPSITQTHIRSIALRDTCCSPSRPKLPPSASSPAVDAAVTCPSSPNLGSSSLRLRDKLWKLTKPGSESAASVNPLPVSSSAAENFVNSAGKRRRKLRRTVVSPG